MALLTEFTGKWARQGMGPEFQSKAESAQCPEGPGAGKAEGGGLHDHLEPGASHVKTAVSELTLE